MILDLKINIICAIAMCAMTFSEHNNRENSGKPETISRQEVDAGSAFPPKRVRLDDFSGLSELGSAEIIELVRGKRLSNTPNGEFVGRLFVEEFEKSGIWINNYNDRPPLKVRGTWITRDNKLCVSAQGRPEQCRSIFLDRKTDEIWMAEYNSRRDTKLFLVFVID